MIVALKAKILLIIIFVLLACQNIGNNNEFDGVWAALTSREQARVLNLLVERVEHDGQAGNVSITFRPISCNGWHRGWSGTKNTSEPIRAWSPTMRVAPDRTGSTASSGFFGIKSAFCLSITPCSHKGDRVFFSCKCANPDKRDTNNEKQTNSPRHYALVRLWPGRTGRPLTAS